MANQKTLKITDMADETTEYSVPLAFKLPINIGQFLQFTTLDGTEVSINIIDISKTELSID